MMESKKKVLCLPGSPEIARMVLLSRSAQACGKANLPVESTKGMNGWMSMMDGRVDDKRWAELLGLFAYGRESATTGAKRPATSRLGREGTVK